MLERGQAAGPQLVVSYPDGVEAIEGVVVAEIGGETVCWAVTHRWE